MTKKVEVVCHSKHSMYGTEVATVTFSDFPYRCIQELATHRTNHPMAIASNDSSDQLVSINPFTEDISRNSESSRAVPTPQLLERVMTNPYIPQWRAAQKGMQGGDQLNIRDRKALNKSWLEHRDNCVKLAEAYYQMGVCKQDISALLLPFMRIDIIATGSGKAWQNFIKLRAEQSAHPDFAAYAYELADLLQSSTPELLEPGEWHIPYGKEVINKIYFTQDILDYSVIRCARFSYKGALAKIDLGKTDINAKAKKLRDDGHMSPFEHQVKCVAHDTFIHRDYKTLEKGWINQRTVIEG